MQHCLSSRLQIYGKSRMELLIMWNRRTKRNAAVFLTAVASVMLSLTVGGLPFSVAGGSEAGGSTDRASAMAVDGAGNVYVTGWSYGSGTESDYATVKYDAGGSELWVARYDGSGNPNDGAAGAAVDTADQ